MLLSSEGKPKKLGISGRSSIPKKLEANQRSEIIVWGVAKISDVTYVKEDTTER